MAYRDDRVATLARAEALERALDKAEQRQAQAEAERDALAVESQLLRAALVRAVSGRVVRFRPRRRPRPRVGAPIAFMLMATLMFVLVAIGVVASDRRAAHGGYAGAPTAAALEHQDRVFRALSRFKQPPTPRLPHSDWCPVRGPRVLDWEGHPAVVDGIELLPW